MRYAEFVLANIRAVDFRIQFAFQPVAQLLKSLRLTLPNYNWCPTDLAQATAIFSIALNVSCKLRPPVFGVCLWLRTVDATTVLMPKTSVNEDRYPVFRQDNVRFTGQITTMQPIFVSESGYRAAHGPLWIPIP